MKKLHFFIATAILLTLSLKGFAQNFTVTSPTDGFHDYLPPLKALGSYQFQITVKNNDTINYTVSIDKGYMIPLDTWVAIANNSQPLIAKATVTFLLTLTIPAGTQESDLTLVIKLNAKDPNNNNHTVNGKNLKLIVDNSPPETIKETLDYTTSSTISVTFDGYDGRSSEYSNFNYGVTGSGYQGIKSFTLVLKNPVGTVIETKPFDATTQLTKAYVFATSVSPYTTYTSTVQAVDMAGNSGTSTPISAKTKPGAPTSFVASSTSYCRVTLNWDAMAGATSYSLWYDSTSPVTTTATTYSFTGLTVATSYTFNVKSLGSDGAGGTSTKTFSTQAVSTPVFSSGLTMCSNNQTIQVNPIADGTSYDWTVTNPLTINGTHSATTTGNSVGVYASVLSGTSTITVKANTLCGISSNIATGLIEVGIPVTPGTLGFRRAGTTCYYQAFISSVPGADSYDWSEDNVNWDLGWGTSYGLFDPNSTVTIYVRARNGCGVSPTKSKTQTMGNRPPNCTMKPVQNSTDSIQSVSAVSDNISIYPNPAESEVTVCVSGVSSTSLTSEDDVYINSVTIIDSYGKTRKIQQYGTGLKSVTINIADLPNGFYYIRVNNNSMGKSYKLLIQK